MCMCELRVFGPKKPKLTSLFMRILFHACLLMLPWYLGLFRIEHTSINSLTLLLDIKPESIRNRRNTHSRGNKTFGQPSPNLIYTMQRSGSTFPPIDMCIVLCASRHSHSYSQRHGCNSCAAIKVIPLA